MDESKSAMTGELEKLNRKRTAQEVAQEIANEMTEPFQCYLRPTKAADEIARLEDRIENIRLDLEFARYERDEFKTERDALATALRELLMVSDAESRRKAKAVLNTTKGTR